MKTTKKYENFCRSLEVLSGCDFKKVENDAIYQMGVVGQFHLTFELGWKLLQETMLLHGIAEAKTGSPREIIKKAFTIAFISNEDIWLSMLKERNQSTHIYDEELAVKLVKNIETVYLPCFRDFSRTMQEKIEEIA